MSSQRTLPSCGPQGARRRHCTLPGAIRVYGADFAIRFAGLGVKSIRAPIQAPRATAIAERVVRSLRRECLDHILPLGEGHLRLARLAEFVSYYKQDRLHRSLGLETPVPILRRLHGGGLPACPQWLGPCV